MLPFVLMLVMHRKNFTETVTEEQENQVNLDETYNSSAQLLSASHITGLTQSASQFEPNSS